MTLNVCAVCLLSVSFDTNIQFMGLKVKPQKSSGQLLIIIDALAFIFSPQNGQYGAGFVSSFKNKTKNLSIY